MGDSFDLNGLDERSFEHLVNMLALRVLGHGHTGFGPGPDGGRDGYYEGEAPYPSTTDRWKGLWYIQCKFHKPHLSKDPQKWLIEQVDKELKQFKAPASKAPASKRKWPNNWIIATNIDPSGVPETGAFDRVRKAVRKAHRSLTGHCHIWGGRKIIDLLTLYPEVAQRYGHFLTPGRVLAELHRFIKDAAADIDTIVNFLVARQFTEHQYTKLEQAGSTADSRPGIHKLFIDLPFEAREYNVSGMVMESLVLASARVHRKDQSQPESEKWRSWRRHPARARSWIIKGGPGQGKSTITQYLCQIQRAALILEDVNVRATVQATETAKEVRDAAQKTNYWPVKARLPMSIELKEYAHWLGQRKESDARGLLTYLANRITKHVEQNVSVGTLKQLLKTYMWLIVFDGLDEVPNDVKDNVSCEVRTFIDNVVTELDADVFTICTSRPQGYSGQFSDVDGPIVDLVALSPKQALICAEPVLRIDRGEEEVSKLKGILKAAIESTSIKELITTPLQAHIMAVVIRDGGKPPDRRWQLYNNFYQVIKKREANKSLRDPSLAKLLREDERLLKAVHNRLGFILHARAETSQGAQTHLDRAQFEDLVHTTVSQMVERDVDKTVHAVMQATTDRLVLVSTPDDGDHVRFDIRPLQEFFAAEFLYDSVGADTLRQRMELLAGDSHWREVMHFLLSALVESARMTELAVGIEVLNHLNEKDDEPSLRAYQRAIAGGALLAARLLQEGVLEQDKRIRQDFKGCLDPICALVEPDKLAPLTAVDRPNSNAWLQNFLVSKVLESSPEACFGAMALLVVLLPDGNERLDGILDRLKNWSVNHLESLIRLSVPLKPSSRTSPKPNKWFTKLVLELLLGQHWFALTEAGLRAGLGMLRDRLNITLEVAAQEIHLPQVQIALLNQLVNDKSPASHEVYELKNYGVVAVSYYEHDWMQRPFESSPLRARSRSSTLVAPGILQLIDRILKFAETRSYSDMRSLLGCLSFDKEHLLRALPGHLMAFIPIDPWHLKRSTRALRDLKEQEFLTLMQKHALGDYRVHRPHRSITLQGDAPNRWDEFVQDMPAIALHVLATPHLYVPDLSPALRLTLSRDAEGLNVLIGVVTKDLSLLRRAAAYWGVLLKAAPLQEKELRRSILTAAGSSAVMDDDMMLSLPAIHVPFKLDLPAEAPLLPYIVASVFLPDQRRERVLQKMWLDGVNWSEYVDDVRALELLIRSKSQNEEIRAAALLIYLAYPKRTRPLSDLRNMVVELYAKGRAIWFLRGIMVAVEEMLASQEDADAKMLIGTLIELTMEDYAARSTIQQMLARWRERSIAPLSRGEIGDSWLTAA